MIRKFALLVSISAILLLLAFKTSFRQEEIKIKSRAEVYAGKRSLQCSPDWAAINLDSLANSMVILPGWGNYQWRITSSNDSARLYFQQGISMYYSFHIIEARASFEKAARFDENNAMIYWAQALAYGPNINDYETNIPPDAYMAAQKALALSGNCTPKEKALIDAMAVRYTNDTAIGKPVLNQQYTAALGKAFHTLPKDADVAALYADAIMLEHPWEYWKHNGEPHPWTNNLLKVLESALKNEPNHPGANHYYIHCTEASPNPQRALPSADRLSKLLPSVSHMVHMPSHIYIRSGMYDKGMKVNEMSIKGYNDYKAMFPGVVNNAPLYLIHNLHMQAACAMLGAGYEYAAKSAADCRESFDSSFMSFPAPFGTFVQYVYLTPEFNKVRYGQWDSLLALPELSVNYVYADLLNHWAKGMAYARLKKLAQAREALKYVQANMNKSDMVIVLQPFNAPVDAARVAEKMLAGIIEEEAGNLPGAIALLKEAIQFEDALIYNEPKDWILPVRPYLGAVLLKAGQFTEAEKIFRQDLKDNPNNHWSLKGLHNSLDQQGKKKEAATIRPALEKSLQLAGEKNFPIVY